MVNQQQVPQAVRDFKDPIIEAMRKEKISFQKLTERTWWTEGELATAFNPESTTMPTLKMTETVAKKLGLDANECERLRKAAQASLTSQGTLSTQQPLAA